jgi:hypothetical protein
VLDHGTGKMNTKYTCGVALMISPFFVATHYITKLFNIPQYWGFAPIYHRMTGVAAIFYLVLGLWFLKRFLEYYLKEPAIYVVLLFLLFGTNLLYYSAAEPLMSHVYSFFLFSAYLFFMKKFMEPGKKTIWFLLMSLSFALIVLVRPVNMIVLPFFLLWDIDSKEAMIGRLKLVFHPRHVFPFLLILFVVFIPQMVYWKYISGSYFFYSYGTESFSNWNHPYIAELWFSTLNGFFLYTPAAIFFIAGIIYMTRKKIANGILLGSLFLFISYIFASWNSWFFGCSFGQRSFVEYYSFLALPFGVIIQHAIDRKQRLRYLFLWMVLLGFSWYNVKLSLSYTGCFEGAVWDFTRFRKELGNAGIYPPLKFTKGFNNDYENQILNGSFFIIDTLSRSGKFCMLINPDPVNYRVYKGHAWEFASKKPEQMYISFWARTYNDTAVKALVTCSLDLGKVNLMTMTKEVTDQIKSSGKWYHISQSFDLPGKLNQFTILQVSIRNHGTENYFIDDLRIRFK